MEGEQSQSSSHGSSSSGRRRGSPFPSRPRSRVSHNRDDGYNRIGNSSDRGGRSRGRGRSSPQFWQGGSQQVHHCWQKKGALEGGLTEKERSQQERNASQEISPGSQQFKVFVESDPLSPDYSRLSTPSPGLKIQNVEATGRNAVDGATSHLDPSIEAEVSPNEIVSQQQSRSGAKDQSLKESFPTSKPRDSAQQALIEPFDICLQKTGTPVMLKPSFLVQNRERRNEAKRAAEGLNGKILRPGMVLLKNYLSNSDQVKLVKVCRDLGLGPGGFYQPVFRDGGKMHLKMMCLGRNWDPETGEYGDHRPIDGAEPPSLPLEFCWLVDKAIEESHALIERNSRANNADCTLPRMSPNICIVNFYSSSGRLGLHQDKDESAESLDKGLPVVSFSIGDSGEFLYGDHRDVEKAEKVILESGDILIFGGNSRHIFHGVSSVLPKTAPKALLEETNLRPGRLNLTFREY